VHARKADERVAGQHVQGSPFELFLQPNLANPHQSSAKGDEGFGGASLVTAGMAAHFSVVVRDDYSNLRNDWRDQLAAFAHNLEPALPGRADGGYGSAWHGSVSASVVPGTYNVAYMVTRAGLTRLSASLVAPGGLTATYYDSTATAGFESQPVMARMVEQASEGAAGGAVARGGPLRAHSVTGSGYTVRWAGLFRPSSAQLYTFQTRSLNVSVDAPPTERMKVWIDNQLVIDQWASLSYLDASPTGTHAFAVAYDYYELQMLYQSHKMQQVTVELMGAPEDHPLAPIPSSNLLSAMHLDGSPTSLRAVPGLTDLDASDVYGTHLTVSTAGLRSSFVIVARDRFGNLRGRGGDEFLVQASDGRVSILGEVRDMGAGSYVVDYQPQVVGSYHLKIYMGSTSKLFSLLVHPGVASAHHTAVSGVALSIATAGYSATFTIEARDSFGNVRCLGSDMFNVEILGPGAPGAGADDTLLAVGSTDAAASSDVEPSHRHLLRATYAGLLPATNLGRHTAAFRVSMSGDYRLQVRHVSAHGLNATFFSDALLRDPAVVRVEPAVDYNWGSDSPYQEAGTATEWSVRWRGLMTARYSETYTLHTPIAEADERACPVSACVRCSVAAPCLPCLAALPARACSLPCIAADGP
jgi:hypothetical protein